MPKKRKEADKDIIGPFPEEVEEEEEEAEVEEETEQVCPKEKKKKEAEESDDEEDEDIEEFLENLFETKKEGAKMVRVFREVEIQPSSPTGQAEVPAVTTPKGESPATIYRQEFEERMGRVEEGVRRVGKEVAKLGKRMDEGFGGTRGETPELPAGPEAPRALEIPKAEKLSERKSIVSNSPMKETFDVRNSVKEFLKTQGGMR